MATKQLEKKDTKNGREQQLRPRCSVIEQPEGDILLRLEMPGVAKSSLEIEVDASELRITGRRPMAVSSGGNYLVHERSRGSFYQAYTLDDTIDHGRIDALLEAGVLTLTLHRKESEKPRRIQIKS